MTNYVEVHFNLEKEGDRELINYNLEIQGVESIVEEDDFLLAYFEVEAWERVADFFQIWNHEVKTVKNENWNAIWEASFEPVLIDDFCYVRAPFHPSLEDDGLIDLILEPKMAFGTAHHETTYMMMSKMKTIDFEDKTVFDFGCGTAILSILAEKMGAREIFAIDIEANAVENAIYNAKINQCEKIGCEMKVLEETEVRAFDVVLANINRAVLLSSASKLPKYLKIGGTLLVSGILFEDQDLILEAYTSVGFELQDSIQKGDWMCLEFTTF